MNASRDKQITDLAREIYNGWRRWEERATGVEYRPFSRISSAEQRPFKRLAEGLAKIRRR